MSFSLMKIKENPEKNIFEFMSIFFIYWLTRHQFINLFHSINILIYWTSHYLGNEPFKCYRVYNQSTHIILKDEIEIQNHHSCLLLWRFKARTILFIFYPTCIKKNPLKLKVFNYMSNHNIWFPSSILILSK